MLLDDRTKLAGESFLVVDGPCVCSLEYPRRSNGFAAPDPFEGGIDITLALTRAIERAPLEECSQTLTMRDSRALRILEQLIHQPQLGSGVGER
jgi:hypothetical protein